MKLLRNISLLSIAILGLVGCQTTGNCGPQCGGTDCQTSAGCIGGGYDPSCVMPRPLGTSVRMHNEMQRQGGARSAFVINQHEWFQGGETLGPGGRRHVAEIAQRMQTEQQQVVIEPAEPDLKVYPNMQFAVQQAQATDQNRRMAVIQQLAASGAVGADSRVVIAYPQAEGLRGDQSSRIFRQLNNNNNGGGGLGGGGGGLGGGGGGGFGGGGGGLGGGGGGFGGGNF